MQVSILEQEYENENVQEEEETKDRAIDKVRRILCRSTTLFLIAFLILTILTPILLFYYVLEQSSYDKSVSYTCLVDKSYRVSCGKPNITYLQCTSALCCYEFETNQCFHTLPSQYTYKSINNNLFQSTRKLTPLSNATVPQLKFTIREIDDNTLQIDLNSPEDSQGKNVENKAYEVKMHKDILGVEVYRSRTEDLIFSTFNGPLIASDGFWEWTIYLTNEKLFGLGELMINENGTTKVIYKNREDHNTLPIFMALVNERFHGVYIEHEGPLEVEVLPSRLIVLRSLAGDKIVINLSTGPTPKDVRIQQRLYQSMKIPYWALGAHICRDGLTTIDSAIAEYKEFVKNEKKVQYSSECVHENLYSMLSEVKQDHQLEELIKELQKKSKFMMSISPQIFEKSPLYQKALILDVVYKDENGNPFIGIYINEKVIYLDFHHKSINAWMNELKLSLRNTKIQGFVLRDNWPEEDSYKFTNDDYKFPYVTKIISASMSNTLPWNATAGDENAKIQHILTHNKYGAAQADALDRNFDSEFLVTSSFDHGLNYAAQLQNIDISWTSLKRAITTTLYHSIFGNSLIAIPICGSTRAYDKQLDESVCIRWYLTAATFPLFRISSDEPRRDPSSLATNFARQAAWKALKNRFMLLPYFHSTLYNLEPLVRPMFYDFYFDNETFSLDEQYMIGEALLIAQPLVPDMKHMKVYLPPSVEVWYEFWGGRRINQTKWIGVNIVETDWIMFIAQGFVVPLRNNKNLLIGEYSSIDTFSMAVALKCEQKSCSAEGVLHFEKESLVIKANENELTIQNILSVKSDILCDKQERIWPSVIENAQIYGLEKFVKVSQFESVDLCKQTENEIVIKYVV